MRRRPLLFATQLNKPRAIEVLIAAGAAVNGADKKGWTPLHAAASFGALAPAEPQRQHGAGALQQSHHSAWVVSRLLIHLRAEGEVRLGREAVRV